MSKIQIKSTPSTFHSLEEQSGPISIPLTNDILFKLLMQENQDVLHSFLCALLKFKPAQITSIEIQNTYIPGKTIDDKQTILDIKMVINNVQRINLEMQVLNEGDWKERSIIYLCRTFDSIEKGDSYSHILPAHHIGILDFSLPDLNDAFYYNFYLTDRKTHKIYSDKFALSVLNLNQINLASSEDTESGLPYWAQLFKVKTWEDLKMLAKQDTVFESAANTVNELLQEHTIRMECLQREELLAIDKRRKADFEQLVTERNTLLSENKELYAKIAELEARLDEKVDII